MMIGYTVTNQNPRSSGTNTEPVRKPLKWSEIVTWGNCDAMVGHAPRYRSSRLQKKQIVTEQRSVLIAGEASDRKALWMITFDVSAIKRTSSLSSLWKRLRKEKQYGCSPHWFPQWSETTSMHQRGTSLSRTWSSPWTLLIDSNANYATVQCLHWQRDRSPSRSV